MNQKSIIIMNWKILSYLLIFQFSVLFTLAQKSLVNTFPDADYQRAMELFEKQKYTDARYLFDKVSLRDKNNHTLIQSNAEYYSALCALELYNPDAENLLIRFINTNPGNNKVNEASFNLGRYYFNNKQFKTAIEWFSKTDLGGLKEDQIPEYRFDLGYSYFMTKDYEKARSQFYEIKEKDTKYTAAALYYYSHIAYDQKNYETALEGFLRLRDDDTFSGIVPYYITHIYFLQKKYDKVVEYAPPLLDSVIEKRVGEMSRIIGESYYKLGKYNESLPFFEKYVTNSQSLTPEDRYQIGYAYYQTGDLTNAIRYFEPITGGNTAISQNALYHLADCYLRSNDKQKARLAFSSASGMDFNPDIKENSLFNYAVVTYELSLNPFNEAVKAFNEYLNVYPYSKRADEAYQYLVLAYLSTKNYKAALESLDKVRNKDATIQKAYQRIAFFRGLELYNSLQFDNAIVMFDKSLEFASNDKMLMVRSYYWKGESYYRLQTFNEAIRLYNQFLNTPESNGAEEYKQVYYNLGYCYFNLKNYEQALTQFQTYVGLMKDARINSVGDAYNRIGDCNFMKPSYWVAIEKYEKAISLNVSNTDYALYQKGFALGLVNRPEKKIAVLNQLLTDYPKSSYADDAMFELGRAYITMNSNDKAVDAFNRLINSYPSSNLVPKATLQLGLVNYNQDKDKEAIDYFKQVIEKYQGTDDARNAMQSLKTVYIEMNDVDTYFSYMQKLGTNVDIRFTEQDSLIYNAAENIYMTGDCDKATQQFQKYIERFPNGNFLINANFYIADCNLQKKNTDAAIQGFEYVVKAPKSMFTEQALTSLSTLYFNKKDYSKALDIYKRQELEAEIKTNINDAKIGQMRCLFNLQDFNNALQSSKNVLTIENLPDESKREAHYIAGKSLLSLNNTPDALKEFTLVAKDLKSAEGAECKYLIAKTYYDNGKKDIAEKEIFDFIKKNTPYVYWLGKSFILLSDIYLDRKDDFQATHTLQSLIDYYEIPGDGIIDEAKTKKDAIANRNAANQVKKEQDIEINLNNQKLQ
jgi:TolA-binding protein